MPRLVALVAVPLGVAVAIVLAGCNSDAGPATTATAAAAATTTAETRAPLTTGLPSGVLRAPDGDAAYVPPDPLPGTAPGDLIWARPIDAPVGVHGYFLLYRSESEGGVPIAVSAVLLVPDHPVAGPRPVLSWGHGSTGLGDRCAFTKTIRPGGHAGELTWWRGALERGMAVIATDYEGLGTPGAHPFLMSTSEARGMLDAARAAERFPGIGTGPSSPVVLWGHSQGGQAAATAAEIAATYAPDLAVAGTLVGAPATDLTELASLPPGAHRAGFALMVLAGVHAVHPDVDLGGALTPAGVAAVDAAADACNETAGIETTGLSRSDPASDPGVAAVLAAETPGAGRPRSPVLVYHGEADEQIPLAWSRSLVDAWCAAGATAELRTYPGVSHVGVLDVAATDLDGWIDDRLSRVAVPPAPANGCSAR